MTSLLCWLLFPALGLLVASGLGLLVGRVARAPLEPWLAAPVGLCAGVVVTLPVYKLGGDVAIAAPLVALLAVAGFAVTRREWRARLDPGWPGMALVAVYVLYIAPVVLSGHWSWLGYNFVNDTAVNMVMIDHVADNGVRRLEGVDSTAANLINGTLDARYPMGLHGLLASLHGLVAFLPLEGVYQPFIALIAGLAAMALAGLAVRAGARPVAAAAVGAMAMAANLTYQYAAHGSFKEMTLVLVVGAAAAQCRVIADAPLRAGPVAVLGLVLASGILVFSTAAGPYAAMFAVLLLAALLARPRRPRVSTLARASAVGSAALLLFVLPGLADALAFGRSAETYYSAEEGSSTAQLGHLLRPLPLSEAAGVWLSGDYRVPLTGSAGAATAAIVAIVAILALIAVVAEIRNRRPAAVLALVPCVAVYLVAGPRLGPYATAKLMVLLAPTVLFAAGMGAVYLARRVRTAGVAAAVVVASGVLLSDAMAYNDVRLAPVERLEALRDVAQRAPAEGLVMATEWEEWTKYFAGDRPVNVAPESFSPRPADLIQYFPYFGHSVDLDQLKPEYVQGFTGVLLRRGPATSRPPSNFRLAHRNELYELWERDPGAPEVVEHLGLQTPLDASAPPRCQDIRDLAARAGAGGTLVAQPREPSALLDPAARPPLGWIPTGAPGMVAPRRPGTLRGELEVAGGRYRVWVRATSGRELTVLVDGARIGEVEGINAPEQWLEAGELELAAGPHEVELHRPGGDLEPGDGYSGEIGPVALEPIRDAAPVRVAARDARKRLCGRSWDWIERIGPAPG